MAPKTNKIKVEGEKVCIFEFAHNFSYTYMILRLQVTDCRRILSCLNLSRLQTNLLFHQEVLDKNGGKEEVCFIVIYLIAIQFTKFSDKMLWI